MLGRILGISRTSLWGTWKIIRRQLDNASVRDIVDFLEYDIEPEVWIRRLLRQIGEGTYEPSTARRFAVAKSKGFSRVMTLPAIPDLVLYRVISDYLYRRIRHRQHEHVYFDRSMLAKVQAAATAAARKLMATRVANPYGPTGIDRFLAWLRYDQYRRQLIFGRIYPYIVTCDIANFFASVPFNAVAESLQGIAVPPRMAGLLFLLLERLSIRGDYAESPRVGLAVDEFECSRTLAHMVLFPHDDRMVKLIGEEAYVRWMDDQNMGVRSRSEALKLLGNVQKSLAILHLTPNGEKSRILSLREARRHFHLDLNELLDKADALPHRNAMDRRNLRSRVAQIWPKMRRYEGTGEWEKILKRIYRLAGLARSRLFRRRGARDILQTPELSRRVADYMRCTGTTSGYLRFIQALWQHSDQVYPDVNVTLVESLLRLEPGPRDARNVRRIAANLLSKRLPIPGWSDCAAIAPLIILRVGDRRSLPLLGRCLENAGGRLPPPVVRAAAVVYASFGIRQFRLVRRVAGKSFTRESSTIVQLIERILNYRDVPDRYKARFGTRFDPVAGRQFIDMRSLLAIRLLSLNDKRSVRSWIASLGSQLRRKGVSQYDKRIMKRLLGVHVP